MVKINISRKQSFHSKILIMPHVRFLLVMPYYEHEGLMNHILLFGASCITIQTITTKPKFVSEKPPLKLFHQPS
jgi:hypothetical protein